MTSATKMKPTTIHAPGSATAMVFSHAAPERPATRTTAARHAHPVSFSTPAERPRQ